MCETLLSIDIAVAGSSNLAQVKCEVRVVTRPSLGCFFDRPPEWFLPWEEFQLGSFDTPNLEVCTVSSGGIGINIGRSWSPSAGDEAGRAWFVVSFVGGG